MSHYATIFKDKMQISRYSQSTITNYIYTARLFFLAHKHIKIKDIKETDIERYLLLRIKNDNISQSHLKQILGALKLFYELVLNTRLQLDHLYPKRTETKLPNVLNKAEVKKILDATENLKHKAILSAIYSAGLRLGELINLKINDIDSGRMTIRLR